MADPGPSDNGELVDRILDGASRAFARFGIRACSVERIAREAGVSRITVYRHVGGKTDVFRQVVLRNTRSYFSVLEKRFAKATDLRHIVHAVFTEAQKNYSANPLYRTLIDLEPELILRMLTFDAEGFYVQGVPFLAPFVEPFLARGEDADEVAEWIIRTTISVVGTAGHRLDPYEPEALERLVEFTVAGVPTAARARRRARGTPRAS